MLRAVDVKAVRRYKVWVKFSDKVEGVVDLSHLAGKGVFKRWIKEGEFEKVRIDSESGAVCWDNDIDLCPDTLYIKITRKKVEEIFPNLHPRTANARN